jgi:hypothetical protein
VLSATIHRKWAREFLVRAQEAQSRERAVKYLQFAVDNSVCAQHLESEAKDYPSHEPAADKDEGHDPGRTSTHATVDRA